MTTLKTSEFVDTKRMPSGLMLTRVHAEDPEEDLEVYTVGRSLMSPILLKVQVDRKVLITEVDTVNHLVAEIERPIALIWKTKVKVDLHFRKNPLTWSDRSSDPVWYAEQLNRLMLQSCYGRRWTIPSGLGVVQDH